MNNSDWSAIELPLVAGMRRRSGTRSSTTTLSLWVRRCAPILLLLAGLGLCAKALYIPTKAVLAQWLLDRAWTQSLANDAQPKPPWPWADTHPIAKLKTEINGQTIDQLVLSGASDRNLAFGPAHVLPSARPGTSGHVVISGHRDTHLRWLKDLPIGAQILIEGPDSRQQYEVFASQVIDLQQQKMYLSPDENLLTLVTCYPFDGLLPNTSERYLMHARLVEKTSAKARLSAVSPKPR